MKSSHQCFKTTKTAYPMTNSGLTSCVSELLFRSWLEFISTHELSGTSSMAGWRNGVLIRIGLAFLLLLFLRSFHGSLRRFLDVVVFVAVFLFVTVFS